MKEEAQLSRRRLVSLAPLAALPARLERWPAIANVLAALEKQVSEAAAAGTGGAAQGIHPASPEAYEADPDGPTHSTDADR